MRFLSSEKAAFLVSVASAPFDPRIGDDEGLPAVRRHRQDVDHRALDALSDHHLRRVLHQEERRPHVHGEHRVEELRARVEQRAAVGDGGGIDQHIDAAERLHCGRHDLPAPRRGRARSAATKTVLQPPCGDVVGDRLAALPVAPDDDEAAAPRSAKRRAIASPKPCVPPVTIATLPLNWSLHPSASRAPSTAHATARRRIPPRAGGATLEITSTPVAR